MASSDNDDGSGSDSEANYHIGDVLFHNMSENDLRVDSILLDDLYTGTSSKMRWRRRPNYMYKRFEWKSELIWYLKYCIFPYLDNLLSDGMNYFIWVRERVRKREREKKR